MGVQHESEFAALSNGNSVKSDLPGLNIPGLQTPPPAQAQPQVQPQVQPQMQAQPQFAQAQPQGGQGIAVGRGLLSGATTEFDVPFNQSSGKVEEYLLKLREAAEKYPQLATNRNTWEFLLFDGQSNQAAVSAVVFCRRAGDYVAYFPILIQESSEPLQDRNLGFMTVTNGVQQSVTLPQLVEEMLTSDKYLSTVLPNWVKQSLAAKGVKNVYQVQGLVIPPEMSPDNAQQIGRVLFYANAACESLLMDITNQTTRLSIAEKAADEHLNLKFDFNAGQVATAVGLPVRSDVAIKLFVTKDKNKDNALGQTRSKAISTLNGYMALQYRPTQAPSMVPGQMMPYFAGPTPMFQPTFIINRIDNQFGRATLESQLLALATAGSIMRDNYWYKLFEFNHALPGDGTDPRDIGNITMDVNYPGEETGYTPLKNNADPTALPAFLMKYLHQNVIFLLDIAELGDLAYVQRAFIDAAGVGSKSPDVVQRANAAIINAANYLTNGCFAKHWPGNEPIVYNEVGRVETGYYLNERGEYRDLAEIDHLRLLATCGGDPQYARTYMDSFNPGTADEITRFVNRQKIYQTFFSGYQIRGFARRLTINSKFLMALSVALEECGGAIRIEAQNHQGVATDRSYQNQVLGIPTNGVAGFTQNYWGGFQGNNGFSGTWGQWQAPTYAVYAGQYGAPYTG